MRKQIQTALMPVLPHRGAWAPPQPVADAAAQGAVDALLLTGDLEEAAACAEARGLWAQAIVIACMVGPEEQRQVVNSKPMLQEFEKSRFGRRNGIICFRITKFAS